MNAEQKLRANIKAAALVGHNIKSTCQRCRSTFPADWDACPNLECGETDAIILTFDIFNNPADCLAVIKKLGEIEGASLLYDFKSRQWAIGYEDIPYVQEGFTYPSSDTIETAVAAALLEFK